MAASRDRGKTVKPDRGRLGLVAARRRCSSEVLFPVQGQGARGRLQERQSIAAVRFRARQDPKPSNDRCVPEAQRQVAVAIKQDVRWRCCRKWWKPARPPVHVSRSPLSSRAGSRKGAPAPGSGPRRGRPGTSPNLTSVRHAAPSRGLIDDRSDPLTPRVGCRAGPTHPSLAGPMRTASSRCSEKRSPLPPPVAPIASEWPSPSIGRRLPIRPRVPASAPCGGGPGRIQRAEPIRTGSLSRHSRSTEALHPDPRG